ncbi:deferrochelatase/peroxidase EfeB [Streptomyces samsunensis]|uniref:Deferrochelatase n=1 Tax=Streptomyces autolyticus TaxID=75293 RepID=A0ABM6HFR9_9ACTN|nr:MULTISPECIES: iron uptake transporter deferrochelatase/peroxidase subunit [Streptomyces]MCQ6246635.1 iron uptake transporter deferrochelatase/peroxidase subunit [Streptomyces malaysiensis]AQA12824.1 peroxidase [Streptomyces autolyticus]MCD9594239.1 iron uptake transporter deferrochelatase/peroxidase subunit [Streptomyces sp. 8ZJF_21]MCM3808285.1 iron uptake transporter deferrochelatase/peroxidase subunit [Streptomyces sp. DR7-3]NUH38871.1 deferrochelatase/peroxidase EfeB [Streptomyces samsu
MTTEQTPSSGISRRRLLGSAGAAGAAGLVAGGAAGAYAAEATRSTPEPLNSLGATAVPFHGRRQPGITTPLQAHGHLIAFDLAPGANRKAAAALLRRWSRTAQELMAGEAPPEDTGIALDAGPSSLTVTFGFGRTFFGKAGLGGQLPEALAPLPDFVSDALDPKRSNGDLWIQIGANDALVAFHALRALQREAADTARPRWQMNGFNRTPGATDRPMTTRNLMGQIDGTNNPKPADDDFERRIFVPEKGEPAWMAGGSYAVVRRIRMLLDSWDHLSLKRQEKVVGRRKSDGAPLSGGTETTPVRLDKVNEDGSLAIAGAAHVRVAAPASNQGAAMLRRPFSYHDGFRDDGAPDAGLLFIAWQADPMKGFVPVQRKLDLGDDLSRFLRHETSALFAVPAGCAPGEYVGQALLEG